MRPRFTLWIGLASLVLSSSCGEKENPMGEGLIDAGLAARSDSLIRVFADTAASFQFLCPSDKDVCRTGPGGSLKLFLGSGYGYEADIALSFEDFPVDSSVQVDSARLQLTQRAWVSSPPESLTIHQLTELFREAEVFFGHTLDSIGYDETPLVASMSFEDSLLSIDMTEVVREWYVASELPGLAISGHVLSPGEPHFAVFHSSESVSGDAEVRPILSVYLHSDEDSIADPASHVPRYDTFLLRRDPQADPLSVLEDRITVGKGFPARALLRADLGAVPEKATVNLAALELHIDRDESVYRDSLEIRVHLVEGEWNGSETPHEAVSAGGGWIGPGADSVVIHLPTLVQIWSANLLENHGLLLKWADETESIDFVRIVAPSDPDVSLRPALRIEYSMPPPPWYQQ